MYVILTYLGTYNTLHLHVYMYVSCYHLDTFILQNCDVTSPNVGTIRVSCDSSHQIQVTIIRCINNCCSPTMTGNGYSPLNVIGLDSGIMYSVTINVFDGNQVVLSDQTIMRNITVMSDKSGKIRYKLATI